MNTIQKIGQTFNTFHHLMTELEPFVETQELRLSFTPSGQAFLMGPGFCEPLQADPALHRKVQQEMREIIAKHVPRRVLPGQTFS
ncbi:MAG: hypothetical protein AAGI45_23335 [Cyanobacteria bacterium P01_H01_bin.26]